MYVATYYVDGVCRRVRTGSWLRAEQMAAETNWVLLSVTKVGAVATAPVSKATNEIFK